MLLGIVKGDAEGNLVVEDGRILAEAANVGTKGNLGK